MIDKESHYRSVLDEMIINRKQSTDLPDLALKDLPHFSLFANIDAVSSRLLTALQNQEKICVVGDYDADGATSTVIAVKSLKVMGFTNVDYFVPNRFKHGYGFSKGILDSLEQQGIELIITVDNGVTSIDAVNHAQKKGIDVIITDHHMPGPVLPDCLIINPNLNNCNFPCKDLAGCGVIFYVMLALRSYLKSTGILKADVNMSSFLDLVALGTIADCVTLSPVNQILCRRGISLIRSAKTRPGINALVKLSKLSQPHIQAIEIAFQVAPKINAAGRIDDMSVGVKCLLEENTQKASLYASCLVELNSERKNILDDMYKKAMTHKPGEGATVAYSPEWHEGVIGILASKLKEAHSLPAAVFCDANEHEIKGSIRSIKGVHMRDVLQEIESTSPGTFRSFGGHAMAAGCTIEKHAFDQFVKKFQNKCKQCLAMVDGDEKQRVDLNLPASMHTVEFHDFMHSHCVFGQNFPEPLFEGEFKVLHTRVLSEGKHVKLSLSHGSGLIDAIMFNCSESARYACSGNKVNLKYRLAVNFYQAKRSVQFLIEDFENSIDRSAIGTSN